MSFESKKTIGEQGEDIAESFYKDHDHEILYRNYHTPFGEIDLITKKLDIIYFIEVKYRKTNKYGLGESSISRAKVEKIRKSAEFWVTKEGKKFSYKNLYINALIIDRNEIIEFEIL